jgi:quercetin dioxygenase-like cupin family protein
MEVVKTSLVPETRVNDRVLQWIVADKGAVSSECCSCCIVRFDPGASAKPPHSHPDSEEAIYILSGSGDMLLAGGEAHAVEAGDFLLMRENEIHLLRNTSDTVMQALCFYSSKTDNTKYDFHPMETVGVI